MSRRMLASALLATLTAGGLAACSDDSPVAPPTADHMGTAMAPAAGMDHMSNAVTTNLSALSLTPFTFRAPLEPFRLKQRDFLIQSNRLTDVVMQQSLFAPGAGMWHTHPGPSIIYVLQGEIKLERYTRMDGCTETPVYGPGNAYYEKADQVHRAVVVSSDSAVVLVTRFNIPVGSPTTIPAATPDCSGS